MSLGYGIVNIEPVKSYASAANAIKAVEKVFGPQLQGNSRQFNVAIMCTPEGRFFPLICNVHPNAMGMVIHAGFNVVN